MTIQADEAHFASCWQQRNGDTLYTEDAGWQEFTFKH